MEAETAFGHRYGARAEQYVRDLLEFMDQAARLVANGRVAYESDEWLQLAAEALLHRIGEAIARLDKHAPTVALEHPDINWRSMKAARNLVAHRYDAVDHSMLWQGLAVDLPRDAARVLALLD